MQSPHYKGSDDRKYYQDEGKNKIIIKPQALEIIWGNDSCYWDLPERGPVELVQVCWLDVNGSINLGKLNRRTDYTIQFKLHLTPDSFGWKGSPIYFMAKVGKNGKPTWRRVDLGQYSYGKTFVVPTGTNALKFRYEKENKDDKLIFGLYEVWTGRWKGGLQIEEVIISICR